MNIVIFGLTISSAWANGHATPWRALLKGLHNLGHQATFFERDVAYYAEHRDLPSPEYCDLVLYSDWSDITPRASQALATADVAMVTSYCPDGISASQLMLDAPRPLHVFYDMDTPVTLTALERDGLAIADGAHYLSRELIPEFDLYLSFTGGPILEHIQTTWGARHASALYGSVDPNLYGRAEAPAEFRCAMGYLGTYAPDRQSALERLLLEPARCKSDQRFIVAGSLYPSDLEWPSNVASIPHIEPARHPAFYSANRVTLSVSRGAMRKWGFTPSGRLFEATCCGTPLLTDPFAGLDEFFVAGQEVLTADTTDIAVAVLDLTDRELARVAAAGRARTLADHTGEARARDLIAECEAVAC